LFELLWTDKAWDTFTVLRTVPHDKARYNAVKKTLLYLAQNPRHPSLQTHAYLSLKGPDGEKVFEAYSQQKTSAAYRVFWYYGSTKGTIIILAITPHP
jgi:hypothetical protein